MAVDTAAEIARLHAIIVSQEEELQQLRAQVIALKTGPLEAMQCAIRLSENPVVMLREVQRFSRGQ